MPSAPDFEMVAQQSPALSVAQVQEKREELTRQLRAAIGLLRASVAEQQGHNKEALELADNAVTAYEANGQARSAIQAVGVSFSYGRRAR